MILSSCVKRFSVGSIIGLALFAVVSEIQLAAGQEFTAIALPIALGLGWFLAPLQPSVCAAQPERTPPWLALVCLILIGSVCGALVYGSLATPSRHWDGVVAWELKADFLTATPSLDQDFFSRAGVYHHSSDYPLLQPVCIAAGNRLFGEGMGRLLFPFLYLVLLALVGMTLRSLCTRAWLAAAGVLALGLTPMLVNPVMGGADSGFAELYVATAVAGIAAGMILELHYLLAAATLLVVLVKPEGLIYGALPIVISWYRQDRAGMRAALAGYSLALAIWLPLQYRLQHPGLGNGIAASVFTAVLAAAALVIASDLLLARLGTSQRRRALVIALATLMVLLFAPLLLTALGNQDGTLAVYLADPGRILERLPRLPEIAYGFVDRGIFSLRFALTFVLFALIIGAQVLNRRKLCEPRLAAFTTLGLLSLFLAFLLSPEENLDHQIRSSMDRLLLHWLGPAWLLTTLSIDALWSNTSQVETR